MSPFAKVRKPWVSEEGQAAFSAACFWQSPPQPVAPRSRQVAPQSTGLPQDLRFVTVLHTPAQIVARDLGWQPLFF